MLVTSSMFVPGRPF